VIILLIHSSCCLSYVGPQLLPKPVSHGVRSSASSFNFQYLLFSWGSTGGCLNLLPHLPTTSTLPSISPSIMCFRRQYLRKMWPIQYAFLLCIVCTVSLSSLTLCNSPSLLTRSTQLISIFYSITEVSNLLCEASKIQHRANLCSKCRTSSINLSPVCWWKESTATTFPSSSWMLFSSWPNLDSISRVRFQSSFVMPRKLLQQPNNIRE